MASTYHHPVFRASFAHRYQFQVPVDPFNHTTGDLLPLVQPHSSLPLGSADAKVEAYCYRYDGVPLNTHSCSHNHFLVEHVFLSPTNLKMTAVYHDYILFASHRICMSRLDGGRAVPVPLPKTYDSAQWELFRRLLAASPSATNASDFLYFAGPLGNSSGASSKFVLPLAWVVEAVWSCFDAL